MVAGTVVVIIGALVAYKLYNYFNGDGGVKPTPTSIPTSIPKPVATRSRPLKIAEPLEVEKEEELNPKLFFYIVNNYDDISRRKKVINFYNSLNDQGKL
jgi:hypothetical protein